MHPHVTHGSLGTPESKIQTAPRSVQPFLHSSRQSVAILYNGLPFPLPTALPMGGYGALPNPIPWAYPIPQSKLDLNRLSHFAELTTVTDRQTHHVG